MRLSQGLVEWVAVSAPPPVAAGGGASHAREVMDGKSLGMFGWLELSGRAAQNRCKTR
jgi:hypothetical protein